MESSVDYYEILGFSEKEKKLQGEDFTNLLKKKWKQKAVEFHPDKYADKSEDEKNAAEEKFKQISEAYEILNDAQKRQLYDTYGTVNPHPGEGFNPFNPFGFNPFGFNPFGRTNKPRIIKGSDVKVPLEVTLKQIYNNETVNLSYDVYVPCDECNGKGTVNGKVENCPYCHGTGVYTVTQSNGYMTSVQQTSCPHCNATGKKVTNPCDKCNGEGVVLKKQTIALSLPKGCYDGIVLKLAHQGNCPPRNEGERGDLKIHIVVNWNDNFAPITHTDLKCTVNVSVLDCITGCVKEITLPNNEKVELKIPSGLNNGTLLVGQYGLIKDDGVRGALVAEINTLMPKNIDSEEKELVNKLKEMPNFKNL